MCVVCCNFCHLGPFQPTKTPQLRRLWCWVLVGRWRLPHTQQMLRAAPPYTPCLSFVTWQTINARSLSTALRHTGLRCPVADHISMQGTAIVVGLGFGGCCGVELKACPLLRCYAVVVGCATSVAQLNSLGTILKCSPMAH